MRISFSPRVVWSLAGLSLCVVLSAGFAGAAVAAEKEFLPQLAEGKTWKLAWNDEFNGSEVDQSKWELCGDWKRRDGFWVKEDSYLDGQGNLILRTKKDGDR